MDRFERFLTGLAAAVATAFAPLTDEPPRPAEPVPVTIPTTPPPLPRPRPIAEAPVDDGAAAVMMWADGERPPAEVLNQLAELAGAAGAEPPPAAEPEAIPFAALAAPPIAEPPLIVEPLPADVAAAPDTAAPADGEAPPLPERNPLATGEITVAALPEPRFTPLPPLEHDNVCLARLGDLAIEATLQPPMNDGVCGIATPLDIAAVGPEGLAVAFTPDALVDCSVAAALTEWLEEDVQPAARSILGQWVVGIRVAASYACRGINNDPTAALSQHAFGRAIDISAFQLEDGTWIEVQPFAPDATEPAAEFLAAIRSEACGPFTTVLGPGVALHDDHFHLDLAMRSAGDHWALYCP